MRNFLLTNLSGQLDNLWLNFKIDIKPDYNFFDALQQHGWKWEDPLPLGTNGAPFTLTNNWSNGNNCPPIITSCLQFTSNGEFLFDRCDSDLFHALCEFNLPGQSTSPPLPTTITPQSNHSPTTNEFPTNSPNLSPGYNSSLITSVAQVATQSITTPFGTTSINSSTDVYSLLTTLITDSQTVTLPVTTPFAAISTTNRPCLYRSRH